MSSITEKMYDCLMMKKRQKLNQLIKNSITHKKPKSKFIQDFLVNKSDVPLNQNEINLLNNGLKFALPHKSLPLKDLIVDAEIAINKIEADKSDGIRNDVQQILSNVKFDTSVSTNKMYDAVRSLNSKDIFITKADKGNCVVVLNKSDYDSGMKKLIDEGNYERVRNPLNKMNNEVKAAVAKHSELFGHYWAKRMRKSNVRVPCIYGLPKLHKPGNQYRPIVANYDSPCANIAAWLCQRFKQMRSHDNFSVKNSFELIEKIKHIELTENERIVSFDIKSYFSNVPKAGALAALREWLDKQQLNHMERNALYELTEVCINQSYFQFREVYYKQKDGLAMGLSLSPFLCNLFMVQVEERLKNYSLFPRFYHRYVDDCIAIVAVNNINDSLELFNSICPEIQFTCEVEQNNQLPFLDLLIQRNKDGHIEFDIYREKNIY
ncbi:uncharacterized protein LOC116349982 [Contarinia nasturtii]|uniref:uncharacterized protein LOC116349982 n=1 Tax=Contarinia nasturtii TaxID=265458 RepID=UPI0012D4B62F|nr:uncharacterized protein LOC116349982 [Contarinia nasturtii]